MQCRTLEYTIRFEVRRDSSDHCRLIGANSQQVSGRSLNLPNITEQNSVRE